MWDESALKTEGYDEVAAVLAKSRGDQPAAATSRDVKGSDDSKVITAEAPRAAASAASPAPRRGAGPSWALTVAIAVAAAVAVYFLVRYLR